MGRIAKITRRAFLITSVAVTGGVAFGYWKYKQPYGNPLDDNLKTDEAAITPYVFIKKDGVTVITPRAEMGQGVQTTLAALVAEELDIDLKNIKIDHGPASVAYYNAAVLAEGVPFRPTDESWMAERARDFMHVPAKFLALQITGGSTSMVDAYEKMRTAGAAARLTLIAAAAKQLGVAATKLKTENGAVIAPNGKRIDYTQLAADAAKIAPPGEVKLKPRSEWKILGKSQPRKDMVAKCTGTAKYAIDVRLSGMKFATLRRNPHLGANMVSFDAQSANKMPGVEKIIKLKDGAAVIANNTWNAFKAAEAISFEWQKPPYPATTKEHFDKVSQAFDNENYDSRLRDDGDVDKAFGNSSVEVYEYRAPYLAHATMEPMTAVALVKGGKLELWAGTQFPTQAVIEAAKITGIPAENIHVNTLLMGGGFGRRSEIDFIKNTAEIANQMKGTPVLVTWSREEDTTHDFYRPLAIGRFRFSVVQGRPYAMDVQVASPSIMAGLMKRIGQSALGPDNTIVQALWEQPYDIENYRVTGYRSSSLLPVGFWRSVGASQNAFFLESALDEVAFEGNVDPLEMRLKIVSHAASRQVIETAREMSEWSKPLPKTRARGFAFCLSFGVPVAQVVEIEQTDDGIAIRKVIVAADVGIALDPTNIEAQIQSGVIFGLTAAITGNITIEDGKVQQQNFDSYELLRINQAPEIVVKVLQNDTRLHGVGEPGTPPAAPALSNAIFALTGKRIRELPLGSNVEFV